jgi:hypothetical protein
MLTDAAHGDGIPRAPRSFPLRRVHHPVLVLLGSIAFCGGLTGCDDGGPTFPDAASYVAVLNGANVRPPLVTTGRGTATFDVRGGIATYTVEGNDLTGPPTVVHLLIGARETIGIPIVALSLVTPVAASGALAAGTIDLRGAITFNNTTISGDSLRTLFENGNAYVNVYTAAYPGGEVRGQVSRVR